jgi:hypothetical protein
VTPVNTRQTTVTHKRTHVCKPQLDSLQAKKYSRERVERLYLLPCVSFAVQFSRLGAVHGAAGGRRSVANGAAAGLDHGYKPLPTRIIRLRRAAAQQLLNRGASRSAGGSFRRSEAGASLGRQRRRRQRASVLYSTCSRYYSRCSTSARPLCPMLVTDCQPSRTSGMLAGWLFSSCPCAPTRRSGRRRAGGH